MKVEVDAVVLPIGYNHKYNSNDIHTPLNNII